MAVVLWTLELKEDRGCDVAGFTSTLSCHQQQLLLTCFIQHLQHLNATTTTTQHSGAKGQAGGTSAEITAWQSCLALESTWSNPHICTCENQDPEYPWVIGGPFPATPFTGLSVHSALTASQRVPGASGRQVPGETGAGEDQWTRQPLGFTELAVQQGNWMRKDTSEQCYKG